MPLSPASSPARNPTGRDYTALPWRHRFGWVALLGSLTAIGAFTIDLYLPAFPVLQRDLSASVGAVQLTLTATMAGIALGQLVVGPLSDAVGRRRPLLAGLGLHVVASLLVAVAPSIEVLGVLRVLQGLGTASASVIALAIVRDRFDGRGAARLIARLMLVVGASPLFAPSLGSALLGVTSWRGIFVVLASMSLLLVAVVWFLVPDSLPVERRRRADLRSVGTGYARLLRDPVMLGLVATGGLVMAAVFAYVADSSFVVQEQFGLSSLGYGLVFAGGGVCVVAGTQTNGSLVHRASSPALLTTALVGAMAAASVLVVTASTGALDLAGVLIPLYAALFFLGLATPNGPVLALERHPATAGTAAALIGAGQFGIASATAPLGSVLGSWLGIAPATAMAVAMAGALALALVALALVVLPGLRASAPVPPGVPAARPGAARAERGHRAPGQRDDRARRSSSSPDAGRRGPRSPSRRSSLVAAARRRGR